MNIDKLLYFTPRIIGILAILFISSFALDVFSEDETFIDIFVGFSMHLIPSIVLIIALVLAWKFELLGGILFLIISCIPFIFLNNEMWVNGFLAFPFFLTGFFFLGHHWYAVKKDI